MSDQHRGSIRRKHIPVSCTTISFGLVKARKHSLTGALEHASPEVVTVETKAATTVKRNCCGDAAGLERVFSFGPPRRPFYVFPNEEESMRRTAALFAAGLMLGATNLLAQAANLAGHWVMVVDPNAPPPTGRGGGRGGLGQEVTIAQDAKTLTITRTTQAGEMKSVYNLDGSDSKNMMTMGGNSVEQVSQAKWVGSKLVIHTSMTFNGAPRETSMSLSMDQAGNLVVESTNPGRGGGSPVTTTTTYKKG
jgi:hypothetical protein